MQPPSSTRPVDLVHLARQTFGDRNLEQEVLTIFARQIADIGNRMRSAAPDERKLLAHSLMGAANGIGAFAMAECAEKIEQNPDDMDQLRRFALLADDARRFIVTLNH